MEAGNDSLKLDMESADIPIVRNLGGRGETETFKFYDSYTYKFLFSKGRVMQFECADKQIYILENGQKRCEDAQRMNTKCEKANGCWFKDYYFFPSKLHHNPSMNDGPKYENLPYPILFYSFKCNQNQIGVGKYGKFYCYNTEPRTTADLACGTDPAYYKKYGLTDKVKPEKGMSELENEPVIPKCQKGQYCAFANDVNGFNPTNSECSSKSQDLEKECGQDEGCIYKATHNEYGQILQFSRVCKKGEVGTFYSSDTISLECEIRIDDGQECPVGKSCVCGKFNDGRRPNRDGRVCKSEQRCKKYSSATYKCFGYEN